MSKKYETAIQKTFETASNAKGIRLDVWVVDSKGKQYNIEMQTINNRNLSRRIGKTQLDDGASKIIVNSSASEKVKDKNLKAFLEYMNGQEPKMKMYNFDRH